MFPSTFLESQLTAVHQGPQNTCSGQLAKHVTANNTTIFDTTAIILFQQIEVTLLIQDVVAIFSFEYFLQHKEDLKWASML